MSAENSPMTRDSIELSLCHYWEILVGQCTLGPPRQARSGLDRPAGSRKAISKRTIRQRWPADRRARTTHARCLKTAGLKLSDGPKVTSWPRFSPAGRRHHAGRLTSGERRDVRSGPRQALCRADDGLSRPRHAKPRDRGGEQRRPPAAALQQARHSRHRHRTRPCLGRPRDEGPRHPDTDRIVRPRHGATPGRRGHRRRSHGGEQRAVPCAGRRRFPVPASPCSSTPRASPPSRSPPRPVSRREWPSSSSRQTACASSTSSRSRRRAARCRYSPAAGTRRGNAGGGLVGRWRRSVSSFTDQGIH